MEKLFGMWLCIVGPILVMPIYVVICIQQACNPVHENRAL